MFIIGSGASTDLSMTYPGSIVAAGTAAQPIVFTSAADTPAPGDWVGISFTSTTTPANVLDHVSLEYTGAHSGWAGFSCLPAGDTDNAAILIANYVPPAAFLTNSSIVKGAGNGVIRGWGGGGGPSFLAGNTFDVGMCPETMPPPPGGCQVNPTCQ
jgi:hypothetical protein